MYLDSFEFPHHGIFRFEWVEFTFYNPLHQPPMSYFYRLSPTHYGLETPKGLTGQVTVISCLIPKPMEYSFLVSGDSQIAPARGYFKFVVISDYSPVQQVKEVSYDISTEFVVLNCFPAEYFLLILVEGFDTIS
jgi:hypothetical protein